MFENIREQIKIVLFNFFCKKIENDQESDVFIIGIPGGITKYNEILTNNFRVMAFEISNAVEPDAIIFNLDPGDYTKNFFKNIDYIVYRKLGNNINCYVLSDKRVDISESLDSTEFSFVTVDKKLIDKRIKEYTKVESKPIFSSVEINQLGDMSSLIEEVLSDTNVRVL